MFAFEVNADSQREIRSLRDRLSNRLGVTAVVRAVLVADAQPELAVTLKDETGIVNLIVQPEVWERHHQAARAATVLMAHGVLQRTSRSSMYSSAALKTCPANWSRSKPSPATSADHDQAPTALRQSRVHLVPCVVDWYCRRRSAAIAMSPQGSSHQSGTKTKEAGRLPAGSSRL